MKHFKEDPRRVLILGGGSGGMAALEMLRDESLVEIVGVADVNPDAEGMKLAKELGIPVFDSIEAGIAACAPCVAFNLTGNEMVEDVVAEKLGVGGVIGGLEARLIVRMINRIKETKKQLLREATHDHLTGIYNRRYIMTLLEKDLSQAARYEFPYSVVLIDLDHFKHVNDTYGHPAGDVVLISAVQALKSSIREADTLGRWGGEEFLVLLPHTPGDEALKVAQKWIDAVAESPVTLPDGQTINISFSAGVASYAETHDRQPVQQRIEALLRQADNNLYQAKRAGRKKACGSSG